MYVLSSGACDLPNSETPMTAARIAAQDARIARVGRYFTGGNQTMAEIVAALTPPVPSGLCDDFTDSGSMENLTPFPVPTPGTVPAAIAARLVAAKLAAAAVGPGPASGPGSGPVPAAWVWTNPGGGASYPHGALQRDVSGLLPAWDWRCGPGAAGGGLGTPSASLLWWVLGGVALWGFLSGGDRRR